MELPNRIQMFSDTEPDDSQDDSPTKPNDDSDDNIEYHIMAQEELKSEKAIKSGFLKKKGEHRRNWKKRWVVLFPTRLCYYSSEKEYEILKIISLDKIHSVAYVETKKRPFVFGLITKERTWYYQADSHTEMESWLQTIRKQLDSLQIDQHPHEVHLHQPPILSPRITTPIAIPNSNYAEIASSPTDYPALPESPMIPNSMTKKVSIDRPSPLAQTWPKNDSESDDEPPISALVKLPGDDIVHCQGWLYKLKTVGGIKTWRKHFYVLRNQKLISYKDESEYEVSRMIELFTVLDILDIEPLKKQKHQQFLFKIVLPKKSWVLCAESEQNRAEWVKALQEVQAQARYIRE